MNWPSFSQRSMTLKPSTSQYHFRLAPASLAVNDGATLTSAEPFGLGAALAATLLVATFLAADFFAAAFLGADFLGAAFLDADFFTVFLAAGLAAFLGDFFVFLAT